MGLRLTLRKSDQHFAKPIVRIDLSRGDGYAKIIPVKEHPSLDVTGINSSWVEAVGLLRTECLKCGYPKERVETGKTQSGWIAGREPGTRRKLKNHTILFLIWFRTVLYLFEFNPRVSEVIPKKSTWQNILVIISYDIESDRTRTRLAKKLKNFGPRVQKSVFEADISEEELTELNKLLEQVKMGKEDSIRLYQLCQACRKRISIRGRGEITEDKRFYIV